ncbi:hypothetical protein FACS1894204_13040 [Synergistales bacterium]|nr:hypothetical protein FACS1894204_13040 [Synergistales bacterium]
MPCVKRMHQESENSGKPEYIFGHMFGAIGVLVGNAEKLFCLPLYASVQDGDSTIRKWDNKKYKVVSHVVRMIKDAFSVVSVMGSSILLLDAYFFTTSALREWIRQTTEQKNKAHVTIVTRAKISVVAYTKPSAHKGRGRPRKKGAAVKVKELFDSERENFKEMKTVLYGKEESIRYLSKDLLWGKGLYQPLRFVLIEYGARWAIFICTNLDFSAEQILRLYGYRFKIEVTFRTLKQLLGGFGYHFWSTAMPKLNRFSKKGEPNPLERIRKPEVRMKIREAFSAIERYVMMCLIATGMLQILALKFSSELRENSFSWLRTISKHDYRLASATFTPTSWS